MFYLIIVSLVASAIPWPTAVGFKSVFGKYPLYPGMWLVTFVVPILYSLRNILNLRELMVLIFHLFMSVVQLISGIVAIGPQGFHIFRVEVTPFRRVGLPRKTPEGSLRPLSIFWKSLLNYSIISAFPVREKVRLVFWCFIGCDSAKIKDQMTCFLTLSRSSLASIQLYWEH